MTKNFYKNLFLIYLIIFTFLIGKYVLIPASNLQTELISPEMMIHSVSKYSNYKTKAIAASCVYYVNETVCSGGEVTVCNTYQIPIFPGIGQGHADEFSSCVTYINCNGANIPKSGISQCGGACNPVDTSCPNCTNGANNYPICNTCNSGYLYNDGSCIQITDQTPNVIYQNPAQIINGVYYYNNNTAPTPSYNLNTFISSTVCDVIRISNDGSINENRRELYSDRSIWSDQSAKVYPYIENISVRCAMNESLLDSAPYVEREARVAHPNWGQTCVSQGNACDQTNNGTYDVNGICSANAPANPASCNITNNCGQVYAGYSCPTGCTATVGISDLNASCITNFTINPNTTVPNSYVDLFWSFGNLQNVNTTCNIYNTTIPSNPQIIPGLQNLNISQVSGRISNIQQDMSIELRCSFVNTNTGNSYGEIIKKQFIKLFRVIEN